MAADDTAHAEALHKLQAMLNLTLTEIGRIFDSPSRRNPDTIARTKHQLQSVVGEARLSFYDALDELESELAAARDVMRRDLGAMLDQQRMKLDEPDDLPAAEHAKLTGPAEGEDAQMPDAAEQPAVPAAPVAPTAPMAPVSGAVKTASPGVVKAESPGAAAAAAAEAIPPPSPSAGQAQEPGPKVEEPPSGPTTAAEKAGSDPPAGADDDQGAQQTTDSLAFDFDSMFADLAGANQGADDVSDKQLDFDLDSTELLPGLESYANLDSNLPPPVLEEGGASDGDGAGANAAEAATTTGDQAGTALTAADFSFVNDSIGDDVLAGGGDYSDMLDFDGAEGMAGTSLDDLFNDLEG